MDFDPTGAPREDLPGLMVQWIASFPPEEQPHAVLRCMAIILKNVDAETARLLRADLAKTGEPLAAEMLNLIDGNLALREITGQPDLRR